MKLWWAQLVLNFLWSPVFFAAHWIGLALVVILLLLAAILAFIVAVEAGSPGAVAVRTLYRLGRFCLATQWRDFRTELRGPQHHER